jgi:serine/threonine-protein kinase
VIAALASAGRVTDITRSRNTIVGARTWKNFRESVAGRLRLSSMSERAGPEPPPPPRHRIDRRYELIEVAGRGGMAVVWRALHRGPGRFERTVAVKQMHAHLCDQEFYREMFREEARVGSLLQDPNIAQVFDFVEDRGQYFMILEWVSGIDLGTYIRYVVEKLGRQTTWEHMVGMAIGVIRGLAAAHGRQKGDGSTEPVVHRDVSPHNILISEAGNVKLIDFGLSFARDRDVDDTDPGISKGKLAYLAPEIVRGGRPTPHSDQFAMGSVLWESLVGRRAFEGETDLGTYRRVANAKTEPLAELRPDIPTDLVAIVNRALCLDPADRFETAQQMAQRLGEVLRDYGVSEDLYAALGETVRSARVDLGMGGRTTDRAEESSIPVLQSGLVTLLLEDDDDDAPPTGFRRFIPRFLRNSTGNV